MRDGVVLGGRLWLGEAVVPALALLERLTLGDAELEVEGVPVCERVAAGLLLPVAAPLADTEAPGAEPVADALATNGELTPPLLEAVGEGEASKEGVALSLAANVLVAEALTEAAVLNVGEAAWLLLEVAADVLLVMLLDVGLLLPVTVEAGLPLLLLVDAAEPVRLAVMLELGVPDWVALRLELGVAVWLAVPERLRVWLTVALLLAVPVAALLVLAVADDEPVFVGDTVAAGVTADGGSCQELWAAVKQGAGRTPRKAIVPAAASAAEMLARSATGSVSSNDGMKR